MNQKVSLVTGGAGFIGSHVADACLALGQRVIVLDDLSGGFTDNVPEGADLVVGSITDPELVANLFDQYRFDYVYHLAAYAAEGLSHFIRRFNYESNILGSVNLINAAVNAGTVQRFVFTSSLAIYGSQEPPMRESMPAHPEEPYGIAKYAVELDLQNAQRMWGLDYTIFRPHNVYGPRQNTGDPYRNVIGIFMKQVVEGKPMTIFGDGKQTRAFSYVEDVAPIIAGCIEMAETANEVFNVGSDEKHSVLEMADQVAVAFAVPPYVVHLPARQEAVHAYADHAKLKAVLAHYGDQNTPFIDGIQRMADYVEAHGVRASKPFEAIEVERNLPSIWRKAEVPDGR